MATRAVVDHGSTKFVCGTNSEFLIRKLSQTNNPCQIERILDGEVRGEQAVCERLVRLIPGPTYLGWPRPWLVAVPEPYLVKQSCSSLFLRRIEFSRSAGLRQLTIVLLHVEGSKCQEQRLGEDCLN